MASEKLSSAPLILLVLFYSGVQQFTEENTMFQLQISLRSKRFRGVGSKETARDRILHYPGQLQMPFGILIVITNL